MVATEIDALAVEAIALNAEVNGVLDRITAVDEDCVGRDVSGSFDVILAGDICYDDDLSAAVSSWLHRQARQGVRVLVGDPGRSFLRTELLREVASYDMPVDGDGQSAADDQVLECKGFSSTSVWEFVGVKG